MIDSFATIKQYESHNKQVSLVNYDDHECIMKIYEDVPTAKNEAEITRMMSITGYAPNVLLYRDNYIISEYIKGDTFLKLYTDYTAQNDIISLENLAIKLCVFLQMFHSVSGKILGYVDFSNYIMDDKGMCIGVSYEFVKDGLPYTDVADAIAFALINAAGGVVAAYPFVKKLLKGFHVELVDVINDIQERLIIRDINKTLPVEDMLETLLSLNDKQFKI